MTELGGSLLGTRVLRSEDPRFLTGGDRYIDNLDLPGARHVVYVRSTVAHGVITAVDVSEAVTMPGVVAVFTGADLDLAPVVPSARLPQAMTRTLLATDRVRYVGEPVAVVVADSRAEAVDAAELVIVDIDPRPAVVDVEAALEPDAPQLFPEAGTNSVYAPRPASAPAEDPFAACEAVVELRIVNQRLAPCPLEVRAGAARVEADGRYTYWSCSQYPHGTRGELAQALGIDEEQVHVITPDVGGGFGAKSGTYPEEILLGWLARRTGRPVRWVETRTESMLNMVHGRAQVHYVRLGGRRDGTLLAYHLRVVQDSGAYPMGAAYLPFLTRTMAQGVYDLPSVQVDIAGAVTTTTPIDAYRGAGRPEATAAIERAIDRFAAEIGMDPAEVRRRNFIPPDAFPFVTKTKATYDCGDYEGALDRALDAADYPALRAEQAERRARGDREQLGIGLSAYVEITNPGAEPEYGSIEVLADGRAILRTGTSAHGQGHATSFAMLAADRTGIPFDRIEVRHGDTDDVPRGNGTGGSRSLQAGGSAIAGAADNLVRDARELAASLLEADPQDVVLDTARGRFHVAGTPAIGRSWEELAAAQAGSRLFAEIDFDPGAATFPFGAHVAVVAVDTETGLVRLVRYVACDDAGRILNPLIVEGQVHGGVAQGVAQALHEEFVYDADGNPLTSNLLDYAFPSAAEFPSFERVPMETPTPLNPLGAKGIGESGTIGATPAVQNAVVDALTPLGVRHIDMPCTPQRVWQAINSAAGTA